MRIPAKQLAKIDGAAPSLGFKASKISLVGKMRRVRASIRSQIESQHQAAFVVFEEAVKFIVAFEDFQFNRDDRPKEATPFIFMLARVRADVIAIRSLLLDGQESAAFAMARVFFEDIEITMATAVDPQFATSFMDAEASNLFWSKNVGYGKIYPYVEKFLQLGKQGQAISAEHISHHKAMKSFLSEHVHPSMGSAFRLVVPVSLEHPGRFANRPLGWFGKGSGTLCLHIAEEIQAFGATCINSFIKPDPPISLANYKPGPLISTFMRPAHNLQTLLSKYSSRICAEYEKKSEQWEKQSKSEA
jgi:hypothetical protein